MPWSVRKGGGARPYKIVRSDTGKVVGSSVSEKKAKASVRARYAAKSDAKKKVFGKRNKRIAKAKPKKKDMRWRYS